MPSELSESRVREIMKCFGRAIDMRPVDSMTREESALWGCTPDGYWRDEAEGRWENDNHGATWGDWAWFHTAERVERA